MFKDSHLTVFTFLSWLDLLGVVLAFWISNLKIFISRLETTDTVTDITNFKKNSELLSKFGEISFQEYVPEGISHPVFYSDLVYKPRRVNYEANFVSSGSKIAKRLRRRKYDQAIIKMTAALLQHCTDLS